MGKVKRLVLDRYEHGLLVKALYELWKEQKQTADECWLEALEDLILKVIDAPEKRSFWRCRI